MRYIALLMLLILFMGCSDSKKLSSSSTMLDGSWTPVRQEMGGKTLPADFFATQKLEIRDSLYTLKAESVDKGILRYQKGKMDIYGKEGVNKGRHLMALYKWENSQLTIVYNLKGDGYPSAFETSSRPMLFLSVFKKD